MTSMMDFINQARVFLGLSMNSERDTGYIMLGRV